MAKTKTTYACNDCGSQFNKWMGRCGDCGAWNSLTEQIMIQSKSTRFIGLAAEVENSVQSLLDMPLNQDDARWQTGSKELDRVLGGGLVAGSVVLIGGDPGIGKSTLLLQTLTHLSQSLSTLYVTGEESLQQVSMRAQRLNVQNKTLRLLASTQVENIIAQAQQEKPQVIVIDSIQTMFTELLQSAPGSVAQVRESAAQLVRFAKQTGTALFLVGHVTKEGTLAGPRVLEHMVDSVLYFEGEKGQRFRVIRAVKNRFGAVNELGIFAMTDKGLRDVSNPSAIFLTRSQNSVAGSIIMATWEGTRTMLVEIQALVDDSQLANPRRVAVGLENNRLAMLLAVLHRHGGIAIHDHDVFVNAVGGVKVSETGADLALLLAVLSSFKNKPLPMDLCVFGEVGLSGEIRPVQNGEDRIKEAAKHGFKHAIVAKANAPKTAIKGIEVTAVEYLSQAMEIFSR